MKTVDKTKTLHERLGITFAELGALYGVRGMLESGALEMHCEDDNWDTTPCHLFNMDHMGEKNKHCGSVGCIGGYMEMIMWPKLKKYGDYTRNTRSRALIPLFYPAYGGAQDYLKITPDQAVEAIDNFLDGDDKPWISLRRDE